MGKDEKYHFNGRTLRSQLMSRFVFFIARSEACASFLSSLPELLLSIPELRSARRLRSEASRDSLLPGAQLFFDALVLNEK